MLIEYSAQAQRSINKLEKNISERILKKIEMLRTTMPSDVIHLQGTDKILRTRVGDYRIIFTKEEKITILSIEHRSKSYL